MKPIGNYIFYPLAIGLFIFTIVGLANKAIEKEKEKVTICHLVNKKVDGEFFDCIECGLDSSTMEHSITCKFQKL
ncbi:MAG: hypothetical protein GY756_24745 [bacterium]|nr:hypothetical protein [bacterium]